jgi:hypothetical protein
MAAFSRCQMRAAGQLSQDSDFRPCAVAARFERYGALAMTRRFNCGAGHIANGNHRHEFTSRAFDPERRRSGGRVRKTRRSDAQRVMPSMISSRQGRIWRSQPSGRLAIDIFHRFLRRTLRCFHRSVHSEQSRHRSPRFSPGCHVRSAGKSSA